MTAISAPVVRPRRSAHPITQTFTVLAQATRSLGLQGRTRWFYLMLFEDALRIRDDHDLARGVAEHVVDRRAEEA
jgi:hypothetical protein